MKNNNYICHASYLRNSIGYDHDFWYTCVKWWYLEGFFSFFWNFFIFWAVRRVKGQKIAQKMKSNNYICHLPYLRKSVAYDHDFWYTCVKWWYISAFFPFFWNFEFLDCYGGKRYLRFISQVSYFIYVTRVWNDNAYRSFFHFFKILIFWVVRGVKGQKIVWNDKKFSVVLDISGTIPHMIIICGTEV